MLITMPTKTVVPAQEHLLVADLCWVALAQLHRTYPGRAGFDPQEIVHAAKELDGDTPRSGIQPHVYQHNVANLPKSSGAYRMFTKLEDGTLRLFRPGDAIDPSRGGKTKPYINELPKEYQPLLSWYEAEYSKRPSGTPTLEDSIIAGIGLGKHLWKAETGDAFVKREREGW